MEKVTTKKELRVSSVKSKNGLIDLLSKHNAFVMVNLYTLCHIHEILEDDEERNVKILGIFTSTKQVYEAIERYKNLPGFKEKQEVFCGDEYGEGFFISELTSGISYWNGGYTTMEDFAASYGIPIVHDEGEDGESLVCIIDVPYCMQGK